MSAKTAVFLNVSSSVDRRTYPEREFHDGGRK